MSVAINIRALDRIIKINNLFHIGARLQNISKLWQQLVCGYHSLNLKITRMTTFIKVKLEKSDGQKNNDKSRVDAYKLLQNIL